MPLFSKNHFGELTDSILSSAELFLESLEIDISNPGLEVPLSSEESEEWEDVNPLVQQSIEIPDEFKWRQAEQRSLLCDLLEQLKAHSFLKNSGDVQGFFEILNRHCFELSIIKQFFDCVWQLDSSFDFTMFKVLNFNQNAFLYIKIFSDLFFSEFDSDSDSESEEVEIEERVKTLDLNLRFLAVFNRFLELAKEEAASGEYGLRDEGVILYWAISELWVEAEEGRVPDDFPLDFPYHLHFLAAKNREYPISLSRAIEFDFDAAKEQTDEFEALFSTIKAYSTEARMALSFLYRYRTLIRGKPVNKLEYFSLNMALAALYVELRKAFQGRGDDFLELILALLQFGLEGEYDSAIFLHRLNAFLNVLVFYIQIDLPETINFRPRRAPALFLPYITAIRNGYLESAERLDGDFYVLLCEELDATPDEFSEDMNNKTFLDLEEKIKLSEATLDESEQEHNYFFRQRTQTSLDEESFEFMSRLRSYYHSQWQAEVYALARCSFSVEPQSLKDLILLLADLAKRVWRESPFFVFDRMENLLDSEPLSDSGVASQFSSKTYLPDLSGDIGLTGLFAPRPVRRVQFKSRAGGLQFFSGESPRMLGHRKADIEILPLKSPGPDSPSPIQ